MNYKEKSDIYECLLETANLLDLLKEKIEEMASCLELDEDIDEDESQEITEDEIDDAPTIIEADKAESEE